MNKYLLVCLLLSSTYAGAQVPEDAIRYSWYPQNATARIMATGGAMGSLGGDITAAFVNPAGLGFFKTGEAALTLNYFMKENKALFRQEETNTEKKGMIIGPAGVVFGFGDKYRPNKSNAFAIAFNQLASFNNTINYKAFNNYSSFSEQFAEEFRNSRMSIAEVLNTNSALPFTVAPALDAYLIDTVRINDTLRIIAAPEYLLDSGYALRQDFYKRTRGGMYELALSISENKNDKLFYGLTLGIPFLHYNSRTVVKESDTSSSVYNKFKSYTYIDEFKTTGVGANLKLGVIYKPVEYFRVGVAVHSPSIMQLKDTRSSNLNTVLESDSGTTQTYSAASSRFTSDRPGEAKYMQLLPWKAIVSASYVFREIENVSRQRAFITADIEYVNHRGSRFFSENDEPTEGEKAYYKALNKVIKRDYKGAFNFRAGGELKFTVVMARLGFAYYSNPFRDKELKTDQLLLSGGLGYRNKGFFIDLTYVHRTTREVQFPYLLEDRANTFASIKQKQGNIVATFGIKF